METVLALFKIDLGISHEKRDTYFTTHISACSDELQRKGITLDLTSDDDAMLLSDYAVHQYRHRDEDVPLARNLQLRINNRKVRSRCAYSPEIFTWGTIEDLTWGEVK